MKIGEYIEEVLSDHLNFTLKEKSILPLTLKNSKHDVVETIICNSISSEYKNNMPKELTLLRTCEEGIGYIGNYLLK